MAGPKPQAALIILVVEDEDLVRQTDAILHQGVLEPGVTLIHKPFSMDSLVHKVREVLDSRSAVH